jgi:surface antigen
MLGAMFVALSSSVSPALAEDGGYPSATMQCVHAPYATTGVGYWCSGYEWGTTRDNTSGTSIYSSRGYAYRNCTDYVAWKLESQGISSSLTRGRGNGGQWDASSSGVTLTTTPEVGDAAVIHSVYSGDPYGHVAYVEAVQGSTGAYQVKVSQYNWGQDGNYSMTGWQAASTYSKFVDFNGVSTTLGGSSTAETPVVYSSNPLAAIRKSSGKTEVFGVNTQAPQTATNVYTIEQNSSGTWTGQSWDGFGGYLTGITAVTYPSGKIEVFAVNEKASPSVPNVWHRAYDPANGWDADWSQMPNAYFTDLAAVLRSDGLVEIVGVNAKAPTTATNVYTIEQNSSGTWTGQSWSALGGYLTGISAVALPGRGLALFGVNTLTPTSSPDVLTRSYSTANGWESDWSLMPSAYLG